MSELIGPYQTCNIPGRTIFNNLHFFRDYFDSKEDGALLSLDQEQAFDRIDRKFLMMAMEKMKFPPTVLSLVRLLYTNNTVMVRIGKHLTKTIKVEKGVKQGDPAASLLYVLAFEVFLRRLQSRLQPSLLPLDHAVRVTSYADDSHIVIKEHEDFKAVEDEIRNYCKYSGGRLNKDKSTCLLRGSWIDSPPSTDFPITDGKIKILGVYFSDTDCTAANWNNIIEKMASQLVHYDLILQNCGPSVKSHVLCTYILPVLWYRIQVLDPPDHILNQISDMVLRFLWGQNKHWVSKTFVFAPKIHGGLGILNPRNQMETFRIRFALRTLQSDGNYFISLSKLKVQYPKLCSIIIVQLEDFTRLYS
jgi:hypothetical protein